MQTNVQTKQKLLLCAKDAYSIFHIMLDNDTGTSCFWFMFIESFKTCYRDRTKIRISSTMSRKTKIHITCIYMLPPLKHPHIFTRMTLAFDPWPWRPVQQSSLTWWMLMISFIEIRPLSKEIRRHITSGILTHPHWTGDTAVLFVQPFTRQVSVVT